MEGGQTRNLNAETAEAVEECPCSHLSCTVCFLITQGPPAQGWPLPQWAELPHTNHLPRKLPQSSFLANLRKENITLVEVSSFQMTLACIKLTETKSAQIKKYYQKKGL